MDIFYLVCRDRCLIGRADKSLRIATAAGAAGTNTSGADAQTLRRHADRLPRPLAELPGASARFEGGLLLVTLTTGALIFVVFWVLPASNSVRAPCAPHYYRVLTPRSGDEGTGTAPITRGCLAGRRFIFVGATGRVQPCGYLDIDCGNIRDDGFWKVWETSPVLNRLRDDAQLTGKCGVCEYVGVCGGCRARAFAATGDMMAEDPACLYRPTGATDR